VIRSVVKPNNFFYLLTWLLLITHSHGSARLL